MNKPKKPKPRYAKTLVAITKREKGDGFYAHYKTKSKTISIHQDLDLDDFHDFIRAKVIEYVDNYKENK